MGQAKHPTNALALICTNGLPYSSKDNILPRREKNKSHLQFFHVTITLFNANISFRT